MGSDLLRSAAELIDPQGVALYLEVPRSQVILLQAYFELYDGIGTVRTLQGSGPIVCVLTTPAQLDDCINVLEAVHEEVQWSICKEVPPDPL
jgi:hypothetical protein